MFQLNFVYGPLTPVGTVLIILACVRFTAQIVEQGGDSSVVVPVRVDGDGKENARSEGGSEVHYLISLDGIDRHLELRPNRNIISPGAVVESRTGETADSGDPLRNIRVARMANSRQCYYTGSVKGEPTSSAALSLCGGLSGYVLTNGVTYTIEPIGERPDRSAGGKRPHLVRRHLQQSGVCIEETWPGMPILSHSKFFKRTESVSPHQDPDKDLHLETLLVLDKRMVDSHKDIDLEDYILTIFNMAHSLLRDASFGRKINLELVRLIRLEDEDEQMNQSIKNDVKETLDAFADWQAAINPNDDNHPNHHDAAVLITSGKLCKRSMGREICDLAGVAKKGGACNPANQAAVCHDSGLNTGYVLAHQLAHTLGASHDTGSANGSCEPKMEDGSTTLMNPTVTTRSSGWSTCTKRAITSFINNEYGTCLRDKPAEHNFKIPELLPGVMYGADFQCKQILGPKAIECPSGSTCDSLNCKMENSRCMKTGVPPASGTKCGDKMWCYKRECLSEGERVDGVDGGWSNWSDWSQCSRSCGSGVSTAVRRCNNPTPKRGGRPCHGKKNRHKICTTKPCRVGSPSFRDTQCSNFNSWVFPEDKRTHSWKAVQVQGENPCSLYCINENGVVALLKPKVTDGTSCLRGIRNICISGDCKEVPCDLQLESRAVEDVCGICHGNGTECKLVEGIKEFNEAGTHSLITVPAGSRNIRAEETEPSDAVIQVKSSDGNSIYNHRNRVGMFHVPGSQAWLGRIGTDQESVNIPGPISDGIEIMVKNSNPVAVKYSMGIPSELREAHYGWDFVDWTECSARCGQGTQEAVPKCTELIGGLVEDKYCEHLEKPASKVKSCNLGPCSPRWSISEWHECGPCPSRNAKHFRSVNCIIPNGEGEEESEFIESSRCSRPKPHTEEHCSCRNKRQFDFRILSKQNIIRNQSGLPGQIFPDFMQPKPHIVDQFNKQFFPSGTKPEHKVTLMQLENESKESMLKQFKENELKKTIPMIIINGKSYAGLEVDTPMEGYNMNENCGINNSKLKRNLENFDLYLKNNDYFNHCDTIPDKINGTLQNDEGIDLIKCQNTGNEVPNNPILGMNNYNIGSSPLDPQLFNLVPNIDKYFPSYLDKRFKPSKKGCEILPYKNGYHSSKESPLININNKLPEKHNQNYLFEINNDKSNDEIARKEMKNNQVINNNKLPKYFMGGPFKLLNDPNKNCDIYRSKTNKAKNSKTKHISKFKTLNALLEELMTNKSYGDVHPINIRRVDEMNLKFPTDEMSSDFRAIIHVGKKNNTADFYDKLKGEAENMKKSDKFFPYSNECETTTERNEIINNCLTNPSPPPTTEKLCSTTKLTTTTCETPKTTQKTTTTEKPSTTTIKTTTEAACSSAKPTTQTTTTKLTTTTTKLTTTTTKLTTTTACTTKPTLTTECEKPTTVTCSLTEYTTTEKYCTTVNSTIAPKYASATMVATCLPAGTISNETDKQIINKCRLSARKNIQRMMHEEGIQNLLELLNNYGAYNIKMIDRNKMGDIVDEKGLNKEIDEENKDMEDKDDKENEEMKTENSIYLKFNGRENERKPKSTENSKSKNKFKRRIGIGLGSSNKTKKVKTRRKRNMNQASIPGDNILLTVLPTNESKKYTLFPQSISSSKEFNNNQILGSEKNEINPFVKKRETSRFRSQNSNNILKNNKEDIDAKTSLSYKEDVQTNLINPLQEFIPEVIIHPKSVELLKVIGRLKNADEHSEHQNSLHNAISTNVKYQSILKQSPVRKGIENLFAFQPYGRVPANSKITNRSQFTSIPALGLQYPQHQIEENPRVGSDKTSNKPERKIRGLQNNSILKNSLKLEEILELARVQKAFPDKHISKRSIKNNSNYLHFQKLMHDFMEENPNRIDSGSSSNKNNIGLNRTGKKNSFLENIINNAQQTKDQRKSHHVKALTDYNIIGEQNQIVGEF